MTEEPSQKWQSIGTQTKVSIGVIVLLLGGFGVVIKGQYDNKAEVVAAKTELQMAAVQTKNELTNQMGTLSARMTTYESSRNSWTATDMFKWAVHLQQSNPQIKVPEPEVNTK